MKVIVTLCILLCTLSAYANIWTDNFEREELGKDWTPTAWCAGDSPWDWKIEDGILKGIWQHWNAQMLFLAEYPSLNYTIQVKCKIDKSVVEPSLAGAGFIFRSPTSDTKGGCINLFYSWGIGTISSGFMISPVGGWQVAGVVMGNHNLDQWYTLKLVVKDDKFIGYIDDKPICKLSDDRYKGNFVGLWLGSNIDASFDDFIISDRVDDQGLIDFAVESTNKLTTTWGDVKQK